LDKSKPVKIRMSAKKVVAGWVNEMRPVELDAANHFSEAVQENRRCID
jgi:hypothetical protein